MTERPTPLTDAEGVRFGRIMIDWHYPVERNQVTELIPANFARTLERDRAELIGLLWEARADLIPKPNRYPNDLLSRIDALLARLEGE